jgi:hypothetical protein
MKHFGNVEVGWIIRGHYENGAIKAINQVFDKKPDERYLEGLLPKVSNLISYFTVEKVYKIRRSEQNA